MKITKRQLRRIIRESREGIQIEDSIRLALEMNPIMSGIDLIDHVMQDIPGHVYHQRVEDFMDEMLENGQLSWDDEADEWSLA